MKRVIMGMSDDPGGRKFLDGLKLDGFGDYPSSLFDSIRQMVLETRGVQPSVAFSDSSVNTSTVNKQ